MSRKIPYWIPPPLHIKTTPTEDRLCGALDGPAIWVEDRRPNHREDVCDECLFIEARGGVKLGCLLMRCNGGGLHLCHPLDLPPYRLCRS